MVRGMFTEMQFHKAIILQSTFLVASLTLVRRDMFLHCLSTMSQKVNDLPAMLRCAKVSQKSLFGDAEPRALQELKDFTAQAAATVTANNTANQSRREQSGDKSKRKRKSSNPRDFKKKPKNEDATSSYSSPDKPFRGGRPGYKKPRGGRGQGPQSGGQNQFQDQPRGRGRGRGRGNRGRGKPTVY